MLIQSLWDVVNVEAPPHVREMSVGPVRTEDVREFCRRYHYTGIGNNMNWRYGLWHAHVLWGVVSYNMPTAHTCATVFGPDHSAHVWHMGRLALPDLAPRNSESRLIGGSLRLIEQEHPEVWAVLTFADTGIGHIGTVYQATNALYTGTAGPQVHYLDKDGARHSGVRIPAGLAAERGWERVRGAEKHRYIYVLGDKRQRRERMKLLRLPTLPYPKQVADSGEHHTTDASGG